MASASDHRAHAALQPADCLILLPQRLPAAVETSIVPAHYPAECTQSDAFLQPTLRARKGRANSNSFAAVLLSSTVLINRAPGHHYFSMAYTDETAFEPFVFVPKAVRLNPTISWLFQRLPAAVETSIGPAHYPAECTQSDAFLQPSLRAP